MPSKVLLSIITPFYARNHNSYLIGRALDFVERSYSGSWMERIIVDQGSPDGVSSSLRDACNAKGFRYLNLGQGHLPFSIGLCRNRGVQAANGEYVTFQDVDLHGVDSVYEAIKQKLESSEIKFNHLETVPCIYLTEAATTKYLSNDSLIRSSFIDNAYLEGDTSIIQMTAPASSSLIVNKFFYLAQGGVREEFFGHGYEDFELMSRLGYRSNLFHRSHDFYSHNYQYDSLEYKGYRTYLSMFGRNNLEEKNYFVHLYHEAVTDFGYKVRNARNKTLFESFLRKFDETLDEPPALDDHASERITLCVGSRTSLPYRSIRMAVPHLGRVVYRHESDFGNIDDFSEFLHEKEIVRVVFPTPYGNEDRLRLYYWCKNNSFPFVVFDRGALPDSWFFDSGGFNAESSSYSSDHWDRSLSNFEIDSVEQYIHELCASDETLEENGPRKGAHDFKRRFDLIDKRVVFVPLQRPNDSVIRHLSGNVDGVDHFCQKVSYLAQLLPQDWRIVVKQHPLEQKEIKIPGAIVLPADVHVYDAISSSDAVVLINSGVGLLSLCFGKPVFCFGRSFYVHEGLAEQVSDAPELAEKLQLQKQVDRQKLNQFMHYLVFNFYSFATTQYRKVQDGDAARNVAVYINLNVLRIPGQPTVEFSCRKLPMSTSAPAYNYFRAYFKNQAKVNSTNNSTNIVVQSSSAPKGSEVHNPAPKLAVPAKQKQVTQPKSNFPRKIRKLFRDPSSFFKDAIRNRLTS